MKLTRRTLLATGAALAAPAVTRAQTGRAVTVSIGRQPWAAGNSPVTQYMIDNRVFERVAGTLGYNLTCDWRDYPSALPMVEAFVAGSLDFGMWGNTPIVRLIAQQQPIVNLSVGEGHLRFVIAVRRDSPIRNVQDLRGKTIGALLGGDPYNALSQILRYELGNADPRASQITVVNTPTQAQAAALPAGMDAAVVIHPAYLKANAEIGTTAIVNSFGYTEAHYRGPAGEGAGRLLESARRSAFFPDGYYLHRSFWITHQRVVGAHPQLIEAFLVAQQEAVARLSAMDKGDVSQLVQRYWELPRNLGAQVVEDEVLFRRGWCWPTEGDAAAVQEISRFMVDGRLIQQPLTWAQIKNSFMPVVPIFRRAYERAGSQPPAAAFTATDATDLRGQPVWEIERWRDRS